MSETNPENKCNELKPNNITRLKPKDSFNVMFEKQAVLQERFGRLALSRSCNMKVRCDMIKDDIFNLNDELHELMERLPHKNWKKYNRKVLDGWIDEEQRTETLFEYIDALHFFLNIGLILEFTPEEIFHYYIAKNLENHRRQEEGY